MNARFKGFILCLTIFFLAGCKPEKTFLEQEIAVVPLPQLMELGQSSFRFKKSTKLVVENVGQKLVADLFLSQFKKAAGWDLPVVIGGDKASNQVYFKTETVMRPEAYSIQVSPERIEIRAGKPAGFFYALQTLRQLLPDAIEGSLAPPETEWLVPAVFIKDEPVFRWRGFMLDVSRHFFTKAEIFRLIDELAFHKINSLQLHLDDDQGWRIEIKKYPKLTQIGAWREEQGSRPWSYDLRPNPQSGIAQSYGGFYTQEDVHEIVAYAQQRFITIVPEIEMPAHSYAALLAYPELSCSEEKNDDNVFCAGNDSTFIFLKDVLSEVIELFPSKYIHIGGDEADKTAWENCPKCSALMKNKTIGNADGLQSYFISRIDSFLTSKGKTLLGWDEILQGGLAPNAAVMSWRGIQGGIDAARLGHDVVMTPTSPCYFDYYQGPADNEPAAIGGYNPLSKVYQFDPVPAELSESEANHILGGQANLWTEHIQQFSHVEYMAFPRVAALSEALWTPAASKSLNSFSRRIQVLMKRYDKIGINYSSSAFNILADASFDQNQKKLKVSLACDLPDVAIHFTTDGSEPTNLSPVYSEPFVVDRSTTIKAVSFPDNHHAIKTFSDSFDINKATAKMVSYRIPPAEKYAGSGDYCLVNGIRGSANYADGEWQGWLTGNLEAVIDLGQSERISTITLGTLQNNGAWIFFPAKVEFWLSGDGQRFRKAGEAVNDVDPLIQGIQLKDFTTVVDSTEARFVKVVARNIATGPRGHASFGKPVWIFADELKIE